MSRTEMYFVGADGDVGRWMDFHNSWRGAMRVWQTTADELGIAWEETWAITDDLSQSIALRAVMLSTFDNVMVRRENLFRLADYIDEWAKTVDDPGHLLEQAVELREIAKDDDIQAVCWNATSVNYSPWWVYETENDEGRAYNVDKDSKHWFLFDELKE